MLSLQHYIKTVGTGLPLRGDHGMRNFVIWSVLLLAMTGTAFGKQPQRPAEGTRGGPWRGRKLEMVLIPAGEFMMGSPDSDKDAAADEKPQHRVRITKPFYLGKYPVTQEQWKAVMGSNPSHFKGPKNPVEQVSWDDCQQFLKRLNEKAGAAGKFQLPTEAQWEYACRAGSTTRYCFGDDESGLGEYGGTTRTRAASRTLWARRSRMPGGSTTCTGMSGSGARTGMTNGYYAEFARGRSDGACDGLVPRAPRRLLGLPRDTLPLGGSAANGPECRFVLHGAAPAVPRLARIP